MTSNDSQSGLSGQDKSCMLCQHSVSVQGGDQVACLAFLSLCSSSQSAGCREFECKRNHQPLVSE